MKVFGLAKLTLIDYPEKVAATVFTGGCNFRCPFCHNSPLVENINEVETLDQEDVMSYFEKRRGILDGICVSGGEPLVHKDIGDFIARIKDMGYAVKLDTNGSFPDRLIKLVENQLVDYIAMDIKNSPESYGKTVGVNNFDVAPIIESASFLKSGKTDYEFRTTIVKELHNADDVFEMGKNFKGAKAWYLQSFADSGNILVQGLSAPSNEQMNSFKDILEPFAERVLLREMK